MGVVYMIVDVSTYTEIGNVVTMIRRGEKSYATPTFASATSHLQKASRQKEAAKIKDYEYLYFIEKPYIDKEGKAVKVGTSTIFDTMAKFRRYMAIRYLLALKVK
ncbi:hypothetical protein ACFE04_023725 [Oxalis oulophora]